MEEEFILVRFLPQFCLDSIENDCRDDQHHLGGCGGHVVTCRDVELMTERERAAQ